MLVLLEILFVLSPTYVWRFAFGPIKTNFLEVLILAGWFIFTWILIKRKSFGEFINWLRNLPRPLIILVGLFLLSALISTVISPDHSRAIGLLAAYFIQPIGTFFIAGFVFREGRNKISFAKIIFWLVGIISVYAIIQYFTLLGLPKDWWGNSNEPKRALSFFEHPNLFALFLAPLLAFCLPLLADARFKNFFYKICFGLGLGGLLLSLSRGGWYGFLAAALVFVLVKPNPKIRKTFFVLLAAAVLVVGIVPNLRYRVILPFIGEKSADSRFTLAETAWKMIQTAPLLGKGLYGFKTNFDQFNIDPNQISINYPHNIFLNFWVEMGLLGMFSFFGLLIYFFRRAWRQKENPFALGVMLFIVALFVHGLVDIPYLNNALALVFWMIAAL